VGTRHSQGEGRGIFLPLLDSQIAATALAWGLKVVTCNSADFPLMDVVNPFRS
jgi:predicted nucleic acid-binding protein